MKDLLVLVSCALALAAPVAYSKTKQGANLVLTLADNPDPVVPGASLAYVAMVRNRGPETANNVRVRFLLPPNVELVSADECSLKETTVTCKLGSLRPRKSTSLAIVVKPVTEGGLVLQGSVVSKTPDPKRRNNRKAITTTVVPSSITPPSQPTPQPTPPTTPPEPPSEPPVFDTGPGDIVFIDCLAELGGGSPSFRTPAFIGVITQTTVVFGCPGIPIGTGFKRVFSFALNQPAPPGALLATRVFADQSIPHVHPSLYTIEGVLIAGATSAIPVVQPDGSTAYIIPIGGLPAGVWAIDVQKLKISPLGTAPYEVIIQF